MLERSSKEANKNTLETFLLTKQRALFLRTVGEQRVLDIPLSLSKGDYAKYTSFQIFTAIHCTLATVFAVNMEALSVPDTLPP